MDAPSKLDGDQDAMIEGRWSASDRSTDGHRWTNLRYHPDHDGGGR